MSREPHNTVTTGRYLESIVHNYVDPRPQKRSARNRLYDCCTIKHVDKVSDGTHLIPHGMKQGQGGDRSTRVLLLSPP